MIVALVLIAATLAIAAGIGVPMWLKQQQTLARWRPLDTTGMLFDPAQVSAQLLAAEVNRSIWCIAKYGPWTAARVAAGVKGWHVEIHDSAPFADRTGRLVNGWTDIAAATVHIGSTRRALAHELEHVCCFMFTGDAESSHAGWAANGLVAAEDSFLRGEGG